MGTEFWFGKMKEVDGGDGCTLSICVLYLKTKTATRSKEGHYIMIKGSIQEEYITIINTCALNKGAPKHIKQILIDIKGEIDSNTITIGDFNTPLTSMDQTNQTENQ